MPSVVDVQAHIKTPALETRSDQREEPPLHLVRTLLLSNERSLLSYSVMSFVLFVGCSHQIIDILAIKVNLGVCTV